MTLNDWAQIHGFTDREIAALMTAWLRAHDSEDSRPVSVPAVQTYRTGRVPPRARMRAIVGVTTGWVTANDFYDLRLTADE